MRFCFLEIAVEDRTTSKISGQFQKAKLRLRRLFSLQPKVQHYSAPASLRVTKSAFSLWLMRRFASPTSKTAKAVFVGFCSIPRDQPAGLVCVGCHLYVGLDVYVTLLRNFVRNKAFLIPSRRRAFVLCVVLFRRRQKRQAVFGTVTATCHPEHARVVVDVATHYSHLRARRSFA